MYNESEVIIFDNRALFVAYQAQQHEETLALTVGQEPPVIQTPCGSYKAYGKQFSSVSPAVYEIDPRQLLVQANEHQGVVIAIDGGLTVGSLECKQRH